MSPLLLFFVLFSVFSNISSISVFHRSLVPKNINIDINLGKTAPQPEQSRIEVNGSVISKKVINAPFGLASITITNTRPKCPPGFEIDKNYSVNQTTDQNSPPSKGFLGIPFLNKPPPPPGCKKPEKENVNEKEPHVPESVLTHGSNPTHGQNYPSTNILPEQNSYPSQNSWSSSTNVFPEPTTYPSQNNAPFTNNYLSPSTENTDLLVDGVFGITPTSTVSSQRPTVDYNDPEQTGIGSLDVRMPKA